MNFQKPASQYMARPEIELKLKIAPETVSRIAASRALSRIVFGPNVAKRLISTYYDTPAEDLRGQGLALRIREKGGDWVQTVKWAGPTAAQRIELESPAPAGQPLEASDPNVEAVLKPFRDAGDLKALFCTDVRRLTQKVTTDSGSIVEIALDLGELRLPDGSAHEPIGEIELELLSGDAASIFELAEPLIDAFPLRLSFESKAERGFRLASKRGLRARKAERLTLPGDVDEETAFRSILTNVIRHIDGNTELVTARQAPEGVHQIRVAIRRLRAAYGMFRKTVASARLADLVSEAAVIAGELGETRDLDVYLTETLPPVHEAIGADPGLMALDSYASTRREAAWRRASDLVAGPRIDRLLLGLARISELREWNAKDAKAPKKRESARACAKKALARRWRRCADYGEKMSALSIEDRHRMRIQLKKLRYGGAFFGSLFPAAETKAYQKALSTLQDEFGLMNDLAVCERLTTTLAAAAAKNEAGSREDLARATGMILGWSAQRAEGYWNRACENWALLASLPRYWKAVD